MGNIARGQGAYNPSSAAIPFIASSASVRNSSRSRSSSEQSAIRPASDGESQVGIRREVPGVRRDPFLRVP